MTEIFKDGDTFAVVTDVQTESDFVHEMALCLSEMVDRKLFEDDWEFQFSYLLPLITDTICKLRGYKNNVLEQRLLCASSNAIFPRGQMGLPIARHLNGETTSPSDDIKIDEEVNGGLHVS